MGKLVLNIYGRKDNKKVIVKKYETDTIDISFGVVEDIVEVLDKIQAKDNEDIINTMVMQNMKNVKPLLLNVFDGLTEEELRNASTKEIIALIVKIIMFAIGEITALAEKGKNVIGTTA